MNKISSQIMFENWRKIFHMLLGDAALFCFLIALIYMHKITIKRFMAWNIESEEYFLFGSSLFLVRVSFLATSMEEFAFASSHGNGFECILM